MEVRARPPWNLVLTNISWVPLGRTVRTLWVLTYKMRTVAPEKPKN